MAKQNEVFRQSALAKLAAPEELDQTVQITNRRGWIALIGGLAVVVAAVVWSFLGSVPVQLQTTGILFRQDGIQEVRTSQAGRLTDLSVKPGDVLKQGQVIGKLQTDNGEQIDLKAPANGTALEVPVEKGSAVDQGALVASLEQPDKPLKALLFVPLTQSKQLTPGLKVQLSPSYLRPEESGYLLGTVSFVSSLPESPESLYLQIRNKTLVTALSSNALNVPVEVTLEPDANSYTGYRWTTPRGPRTTLSTGTLCLADLELSQQRPISLLLPILRGDDK
ncbi:MAG TPA: HlyD family efflux transporter periplasmic adaptor subunit [Chloroflexia bacterium]|nr:HlyD family efflux transporter periplasmic adaptor subunit [Chloroflexia bacterium]